MTKKEEFSSIDTKQMKGFAIILMLIHHLWGFPERIAGGELKHLITIFGDSSILILGNFSKICVSLFFFLGGYGIYMQSKKKNFNILNNIKKLYIAYWKVFVIFIPIALFFFRNQKAFCSTEYIYAIYNNLSWKKIIICFLGFSNSLNHEWWFLYSYIIAIILFPLIKNIIEKNSIIVNITWIVIVGILMTNVFPIIGTQKVLGTLKNNYLYSSIFCQTAPFITCFYMGILFAKENLIIKLKNSIKQVIDINPLVDIIILIIMVFTRNYIAGAELDIIYVPILIIITLDILNYLPKIKLILRKLGEHSTNMWLTHTFYCYYFYSVVRIIIAPKWAIPCLILLIVFTYITSLLLNCFWKYLNILRIKIINIQKQTRKI